MDTRLQNQAKAPSATSVSPVQTGLFQPRPFAEPEQEAAEAGDSLHQSSNLQTQLESGSRFGHNFSRVQVQTNTPSSIQTQLVNRQPEEQQDEEEANEVAQPLKMMAPPVGEPIERESSEESIQMMPHWSRFTPAIQRQEQEEESIQRMPQLGLFAPAIQRQDEEEPIQMMPQLGVFAPVIQRQEQEDEPIQMMPQWGMLQRSPQEDDGLPMQMMPQWGVIQRQESEGEEEPIQMKWLQAKLVVGTPGDKYEQEADSVAAQVMSMSVPAAHSVPIQRQGEGEEEETEPLVQRSSLVDSITPLVQRQTEEQEDAIQAKSLLQRRGKGNAEAGSDVESQLNQSKGGGSPLPDEVRSFMEPRFGTDFSSVRVHTDSTAVQMNKDLRAQAFTHGSDIYYGSGKSPAQDSLTAHELTHVVQQTGAKKLQAKSLIGLQSNKETLQAKISPATDTAIRLKKAPDSPQADPAFRAVTNKTKQVAQEHKKHPPAKTKSAEAQAAAKPPTNEVESKAQDKQVQEMNQQKPGQFNAAAFKAALKQKIAAVAPQTLEEADKFKDSNKIESVKGEVTSQVTDQKKQASKPIEEKTKEPPNPSGIKPKLVTPLPPNKAGAKPGNVGASGAAPKPKDNSEVSLQEGSKSLDQQMAKANVTDEQLQKSNEPEFKSALGAKKTAQADAAKAPEAYRQQEQGILTKAQAQAQTTVSTELQGIHGSKEQAVAKVLGNQTEAKGQDEQKRTEVANHIQGIYNKTKQKVEASLSQLDSEVNSQFDQGAGAAKSLFENYVDQRMKRYKDKRYSGLGAVRWATDKMFGMPSEVNAFYQEGRTQYLASMDRTIDKIATLVASKLNAAKQEIAKGKQEIQKYVAGLEPSLRQVGQKAAQNIQGKFDELEQSVDNKHNELIDSLAQKYNENLKQQDARIDAMKAENRGLVDKAKDAVGGVIKTIVEMKNLLMGVLAKAAGAIEKIIKDPIGFLGNLVSGLKQGFMNFMGNIGEHLKKGFIGFLTGALGAAGITLPESFTDLKGIFAMVMGVLGLTYEFIRSRVVQHTGEKAASRLEKTYQPLMLLATEGVGGLWQFVKDRIGDLKAMVIDTIQNFIVESVIKSGIMWVLSLLNPASAFVRACKAIVDIVMFFIERGSQIAELVSAVTESVVAIANGAIGGAAKLIEGALEKALPVVIGFLASLVGLGGISEKIQGIIHKVQSPINKAIDAVVGKAAKFAKGFGNKFKDTKFGKKAVGIHESARQKQEAAHKWINDKKEAGKKYVEGKKEALKQGILDQKDKLTNNKLVKKLAAADEWANKKMTSLHNKWDAVKSWPGKKLEALGEKAGGLWGKAKDKFKSSKLGQKLGDKWKSVKDWGSDKWKAAKNKFKQSKLGHALDAAKSKYGKVKEKVLAWWKIDKKFKDKAGNQHRLFFKGKGSTAVLMVASSPQAFADFITSVQIDQNDEASLTAKIEALAIAKQIDSEKQKNVTGSNRTETKQNQEKKKQELERLINQLSSYAKALFGVSEDELPNSEIVFNKKTEEGAVLGASMNAKVLTKKPDPTKEPGSRPVPDQHNIFDKLLKRREGDRSYYVRGHLLNHNIHGPGKWYNMTPLSQAGNKNHLYKAEDKLKAAVESGAIVQYNVVPIYGRKVSIPTNEELEKKNIDSSKWEDLKEIRSAENHVPLELKLEAWLLEKLANGSYKQKQQIVTGVSDNPVETDDLAQYDLSEGNTKREPVSLTKDNVDKIAENTGISKTDLERIQNTALRVSNLSQYLDIIREIINDGSLDPDEKRSLCKIVVKLQGLKNVVLKK
jgi:hypothetical protein